MTTLLSLLNVVFSLGSFVCFIIVLIKLFQAKGVLHGILGLICALYTFIWGWLNVDRYGIRTVMLVWTGLFVISILLGMGVGLIGAGSAAFQ